MTLSAGCQLDVGGLNAEATGAGPGAGGAASTGATTTSASLTGGETMSGGSTSGGDMTSSSASGSCVRTGPEICNDGKDNDCNGAADCADTMCSTGFVCAPPIPSGWKSVAFSPTSKPDCPSGYTSVDVSSVTSAAFNCACSCTLTSAPSCTQGTIIIQSTGAGPCSTTNPRKLDANGGMCGVTDLSTVKNGQVQIDPLPATQGSCSPKVTFAVEPTVQGRACLAPAVGVGCAAGGACVALTQAPLAACITREGKAPCPAGFSKHFAVGTAAQDTRSCATCSCGATATCSNPKLTLFGDGACGGGGLNLPVTSSCDPVNDGNGHHYGSYQYSATMTNPGCQKTQDTAPTGSLMLTEERTICCP